ncbi:beta-carotene 15,15'-monooxygenase [Bergeyella porcorum]|uniref:beta-carotene 15,15'-monooxygenase n=1 Tax=Bergeyella porcorum TaxID=1735111 RepID=UPI0035F0D545
MPDFDIDSLKQQWQAQKISNPYSHSEILNLLNKKSRNYVKYILWVSVIEFLIILGSHLLVDKHHSFFKIMENLDITVTDTLVQQYNTIYITMQVVSLLVTGFFIFKFYFGYKGIKIEENLKQFILKIIYFRKTVNLFIFINIVLFIIYVITLVGFVIGYSSFQNIEIESARALRFIVALSIGIGLCIALALIYYRIVYGILVKRLGKNLKQLQEMDNQQ